MVVNQWPTSGDAARRSQDKVFDPQIKREAISSTPEVPSQPVPVTPFPRELVTSKINFGYFKLGRRACLISFITLHGKFLHVI